MHVLSLRTARRSLARGLARQVMTEAACDSADTARILADLHGMAPNARSRQRFAARLGRRRGVVEARAAADGLEVVLRSVMTVEMRKEGVPCFCEERIAWTRVHVTCGKRSVGFRLDTVHATHHAIQRRVERSDCPLTDLLGALDTAMLRALSRLAKGTVLTDRDDEFLPARQGVWAGGMEETCADPAWGPAFRQGPPIPVFAIRTYLGEEEMRPTVWLGWSEARTAA
ncbi:MAG: hypothetical protein EP320_10220 [Rhodobacteraceae bacterium]|nr:MAG: hypothetical protein EP320_10220 [Paracoccaceae bacterium]